MRQDLDHLRTLAICHFIYGGLQLLGMLAGGVIIGLGMLVMSLPPPPGSGMTMTTVGWFYIMGIFTIVFSLIDGTLTLIAGFDLRKRKRWTLTFTMAIVNAVMGFPLGTVLGVFTIIVLIRPSVKDLYEGKISYYEDDDEDYPRYRRVDEPQREFLEAPAPPAPRPDDDRVQPPGTIR